MNELWLGMNSSCSVPVFYVLKDVWSFLILNRGEMK